MSNNDIKRDVRTSLPVHQVPDLLPEVGDTLFRDLAALFALTGMLSSNSWAPAQAAEVAFAFANAMLAARTRQE